MARPTKCTPDVTRQICEVIATGNYLNVAAEIAGIDFSTFCNWMNWGEQGKSKPFIEFFESIKKVELLNEAARLQRITEKAKEGAWQADAWYLERRHPERWGRTRHEITGKDGVPVQVAVEGSITITRQDLKGLSDDLKSVSFSTMAVRSCLAKKCIHLQALGQRYLEHGNTNHVSSGQR